jgi:hypothetical protein
VHEKEAVSPDATFIVAAPASRADSERHDAKIDPAAAAKLIRWRNALLEDFFLRLSITGSLVDQKGCI